jgi:F-box/TPR repeat protein Pof3
VRGGSSARTHNILLKAVSTSSQPNYQVLDTRAALYAKLDRSKDALKDAKATIEAAPDRWQGYTRAARLFLTSKKIDATNTMIKLALEKLKDNNANRRASLVALQTEIEEAARRADKRRHRYTNYSANLPLEIFGEVVATVVQDNRNAFITMSHVCKLWRSAIQNMPLIWDTPVLTGRHTKRKAALWLEMSHGNIHELDIREEATLIPEFPSVCLKGLKWEGVHVFKTERWNPQDYLISIGRLNGLDTINHLDVALWQSVGFLISTESYQHLTDLSLRTFTLPLALLQEMANTVTNLKSLTLQNVVHEQTLQAVTMFADLFIANRFLENLYVENTTIGIGHLDKDVYWDHIMSLTLKNMDRASFLSARLPRLQTLHVENSFPKLIYSCAGWPWKCQRCHLQSRLSFYVHAFSNPICLLRSFSTFQHLGHSEPGHRSACCVVCCEAHGHPSGAAHMPQAHRCQFLGLQRPNDRPCSQDDSLPTY